MHPSDYHVTIAFLGSLRIDPTGVMEKFLSHLCSGAPHSAVAQRAMMLPRSDWATVIALGFDDENLCAYIATWRDQLRAAAGLPPERRSVLPHLTVARMKPTHNRHQREERRQWMEKLVQQLPHPFRFSAVGLYTWCERALPHQPRYRTTLRSVFAE